jgi:hypothetical protein
LSTANRPAGDSQAGGHNPAAMDILRNFAESHGYFTRQEALDAGYDDNAIRRALKVRLWTRIRQGAYTFTDLWTATDEIEKHLAAARAVARRLAPRVALSHTSAALDHELVVWGAGLSMVHITRLDGASGRTEAGVVHHEGFSVESDVVERDGYLVMKPARAALETCSLVHTEAAVAILDAGLHRKRFDGEEVEAAFALMREWPRTLHLQFAVPFADGRAESVGESRSRYLCHRYRLPAPELQGPVYDDDGELIGVSDFQWKQQRLLGEFDGKIKYGRLLKPGEEPGEVVFREKVREDAMRRVTGCAMVRLIWSDLNRGPETAARIRRLMQP